jgi:hypothetical protein
MFDKKQVQEAINRVDTLLGRARIVEPILSRQDHITLVNDMRLIQGCCMEYFEEQEDDRTIKFVDSVGTGNQDCKGSGNSIQGDERDGSGDAPREQR